MANHFIRHTEIFQTDVLFKIVYACIFDTLTYRQTENEHFRSYLQYIENALYINFDVRNPFPKFVTPFYKKSIQNLL